MMITSPTPTQMRLHQERMERMARIALASRPAKLPAPPPPEPLILDEAAELRKLELRAAFERIAPSSKVIHEVAVKYGLRPDEITSKFRYRRLVPARHECCFRLVVECGMSYPQAGRRLGGMDHTSVLHGLRKHLQRHPDMLPVFADTIGARDDERASLNREVSRLYFDENWSVPQIMHECDIDRNMVNSIIRSEVRKARHHASEQARVA